LRPFFRFWIDLFLRFLESYSSSLLPLHSLTCTPDHRASGTENNIKARRRQGSEDPWERTLPACSAPSRPSKGALKQPWVQHTGAWSSAMASCIDTRRG